MSLNERLKTELHKLGIDDGFLLRFDSLTNITFVEFQTFTLSIYETEYGSKQECDICFKSFDVEMPVNKIDFFKDQNIKPHFISSIEDIFNILKQHINEILNSKTIPDWYLNYIGWSKFSREVLKILYGLSPSDLIRTKWLRKDPTWKMDFKERFPDISNSGNDFFWSRM